MEIHGGEGQGVAGFGAPLHQPAECEPRGFSGTGGVDSGAVAVQARSEFCHQFEEVSSFAQLCAHFVSMWLVLSHRVF